MLNLGPGRSTAPAAAVAVLSVPWAYRTALHLPTTPAALFSVQHYSAPLSPRYGESSDRTAAAPPVTERSVTRPLPAAPRPTAPRQDVAAVRLAGLLAGAGSRAAVAAWDPVTGATVVAGATEHGFVSASIAKVDILAALLLAAQDRGGGLSAGQRVLAARMIEHSDNDAADLLFREVGGAGGIDRANQRLGLTSTVPSPHWGLTRTTAADQLQLLRQVFTDRSLLSAGSRRVIQGLMSQVEPDQRWGVSAAAEGDQVALKNGWLPRPDGTWVINSIGQARHGGRPLLLALLSEGNPSEPHGIALLQSLATAAADTLLHRAETSP
jgi:beta-lactamase class A